MEELGWEDRQDASFRGVPFLLKTVRGKTGRNALPHEYPKRDLGWTEDNGGVLNNEQIKAVLVGPDYMAQFERLLNALNTAGPGELVHPWWGIQQVQIGEVDYDLDNNEQDIARVSFTVYSAGENLFPGDTPDTQKAVNQSVETAAEASADAFEEQVAPLTAEAAKTLGETIDGYLDNLDEFVNGLPGLPDEIGDWVDRLDRMKWSVGRLLAYPGQLAREATNLIFDVKDLLTTLPLSLSVYDQLERRWKGLRAELDEKKSGNDPVSQKKHQVKIAVNEMSLTAVALAKASAVANGEMTDTRQASVLSDELSGSIQERAEQAIEIGNRDGWRALRKLRIELVADIAERARQLPQMREVKPTRTIPVALLAYQQTGDTERRDEIVARNGLSRPSFIMQGQTVEVIDANNGQGTA